MDRTRGKNYSLENGKRLFTDGPPATTIHSEWLNSIQEEYMTVIEEAGLTPEAGEVQFPSASWLVAMDAGVDALNSGLFAANVMREHEWVEQANPKAANLQDICWSSELSLFIAVGDPDGVDAYILTSPDGINWTERANPKNVNLQSVYFDTLIGGVNMMYAVGNADGVDAYIVGSNNGIAWAEEANPKNFNLYGVCHAAIGGVDIWVAVGFADGVDSYIVRKQGVAAWAEQAPTVAKNINLYDVCWSPDLSLFVAVGAADGVDAYILTSPDGITWTEQVNPVNSSLYGVVWSPELGLFCAAGSLVVGSDIYIVTSPDGTTWTEQSNPIRNAATHSWRGCWAADIGFFVFAGEENLVGNFLIASPDGENWSAYGNPQMGIELRSVAWSPELELFCAVGLIDATPDAYIITYDAQFML